MIRAMHTTDLPIVAQLYQDANPFAKVSDIHTWTLEGLQNHPNLQFVYEVEGNIIGAISAIITKNNSIEINDIVVAKEHRKQGIGTMLMKHMLKAIAPLQSKHVSLWIHWSNAAAVPFYYTFGFRLKECMVTHNVPGVPNGEDCICMEKILRSNEMYNRSDRNA